MWKDFPFVFGAAVITVVLILGAGIRSHRPEQIAEIHHTQMVQWLDGEIAKTHTPLVVLEITNPDDPASPPHLKAVRKIVGAYWQSATIIEVDATEHRDEVAALIGSNSLNLPYMLILNDSAVALGYNHPFPDRYTVSEDDIRDAVEQALAKVRKPQ